MELLEALITTIDETEGEGAILVFLPGKHAIKKEQWSQAKGMPSNKVIDLQVAEGRLICLSHMPWS